MTEKSFIGGMILVGLTVFLIICMSIQSCQVDYKPMIYEDPIKEEETVTCCYFNSTEYDVYNDKCVGAPENATEGLSQRDLLENIKYLNAHIYLILIIVLLGLAVLGAMLMIG